jgi:outer membrane protein
MRKFFIAFLLMTLSGVLLNAQENTKKFSLRAAYGYASEKDLGDILLTADFSKHPLNLTVTTLDGGYLLKSGLYGMPIDVYAKGGFSHFKDVSSYRLGNVVYGGHSDVYEVLAYIKLLYNFDFLKNRVRVGFGEGISYVNHLLVAEVYDATNPLTNQQDPTARFLNYLDITLDFDLGKLIRVKSLEDVYVGYLLKHRSGVFGLYSGVHGGSNYNSFYVEAKF